MEDMSFEAMKARQLQQPFLKRDGSQKQDISKEGASAWR